MNPFLTIALITCSLSLSTVSRAENLTVSIRDVTSEYALTPAPTPTDEPSDDVSNMPTVDAEPTPNPSSLGSLLGKIDWDKVITLGEKVWQYLIDHQPNATYQSVKTSVVPQGISKWTQLTGWSKPVSRVYRVEFRNVFGRVASSFDYRISYVYGGGYKGKGRYIGQLTFIPETIKLKTGRNLDVKAEIINTFNFGTEAAPIAAAQLQVSWSSPILTRYQMSSAEYFIYGTGEIQDLTGGTAQ